MYLVSGCLLGRNCKYNGGNNHNDSVIAFYESHSCFVVCPETAAGLPAPRPPAEQQGDKVMDKEGKDVTEAFLTGSKKTWEACCKEAERRGESIEGAILKAKSPSCGSNMIYDGTFTGNLIPGDGTFTKILKAHGIHVMTEKEI